MDIVAATRRGGLTLLLACLPAVAGPVVTPTRLPAGGLQPEALVDGDGRLHVLWFAGDPAAGDLYYATAGQVPAGAPPALSSGVRVNSRPGTAIAIGTVRGGHLAVGAGRVHVAWMSADRGDPGMDYTRTDGAGGFEPQRNLSTRETELDGGGSVAADGAGGVWVAWHAGAQEPSRHLWLAASSDSGGTFAPEVRANPLETGACGCCGMRAAAGPGGALYLLFRAAAESVHRDMQLVRSGDGGGTFTQATLEPWELNACPMSTAAIAPTARGAVVAWETDGQVSWLAVDAAEAGRLGMPTPAPGAAAGRKHPAVAVDAEGRVALAWTEGAGWNRGGDLAWQVWSAAGAPLDAGRLEGVVPTWSRAAVVARPDGGFLLFH